MMTFLDLGLTPTTIELDARDRTQLVILAYQSGIVTAVSGRPIIGPPERLAPGRRRSRE